MERRRWEGDRQEESALLNLFVEWHFREESGLFLLLRNGVFKTLSEEDERASPSPSPSRSPFSTDTPGTRRRRPGRRREGICVEFNIK